MMLECLGGPPCLCRILASLEVAYIAKWTSVRSNFDSSSVAGVLHNWEASLFCGVKKSEEVGISGSSMSVKI